jgi:hypothetical protein
VKKNLKTLEESVGFCTALFHSKYFLRMAEFVDATVLEIHSSENNHRKVMANIPAVLRPINWKVPHTKNYLILKVY